MLDFIKEIKERNAKIQARLEELSNQEIVKHFDVGPQILRIDDYPSSPSMRIFHTGVFLQRIAGAEYTKDEELIKSAKKDLADYEVNYAYHKEDKELREEFNENRYLLKEAESLLSEEEKRQRFLEQNKK